MAKPSLPAIWLLSLLAVLLAFAAVYGRRHSIKEVTMTRSREETAPDSVTYIGHATVLIRLGGDAVLTDPHLGDRVAFHRRAVPLALLFDLPPLNAIVISHGHWDHYDRSTLERLDKDTVLVVPYALRRSAARFGFREVRALRAWQATAVGKLTITAVPARHFGAASGYLITSGPRTVYFAGDTGLFDGMETIGERRRIDLALLPIGAYRPHASFIPGAAAAMRRVHMAPEDLPTAVTMLGAHLVVPIHWGTFKLTGEPLGEPLERLKRVIEDNHLEERVQLVPHGVNARF